MYNVTALGSLSDSVNLVAEISYYYYLVRSALDDAIRPDITRMTRVPRGTLHSHTT